jgi:hypothetical protein
MKSGQLDVFINLTDKGIVNGKVPNQQQQPSFILYRQSHDSLLCIPLNLS